MSFDAASQNLFYAGAAYVKQTPDSVWGEYGTGPTQGAVSKVVKNMIQKLSNSPNQSLRTSYAQGDLLYHVKQGNGKVFICVSGKQMPLRIAFNFLGFVSIIHSICCYRVISFNRGCGIKTKS